MRSDSLSFARGCRYFLKENIMQPEQVLYRTIISESVSFSSTQKQKRPVSRNETHRTISTPRFLTPSFLELHSKTSLDCSKIPRPFLQEPLEGDGEVWPRDFCTEINLDSNPIPIHTTSSLLPKRAYNTKTTLRGVSYSAECCGA